MDNDNSDLLTRGQVAKRLNVCRHTIARLTKKGRLRPIYINSRLVRYRREDVDRLISGCSPDNHEVPESADREFAKRHTVAKRGGAE